MKESILITGGLGFIGSRFAKLCIEKGHNVKIIDKMTYAADPKRLHDTVPNWIEFPFNKLDICDVTVNDINGCLSLEMILKSLYKYLQMKCMEILNMY